MQRELRDNRVGSRVLVDPATNIQWVVVEIRDRLYDRRDSRSLVFLTDGVMRRVRNYPPDWFELADADLLGLSRAH
jgi:hypothetical protein